MKLTKNALRALIALGLAGMVVFGAATLTAYPPPNCDEAYIASSFVSLRTRGTPGLAFFPLDDPAGAAINLVQLGRLHLLGVSAVLSLLGVNLLAARIYAFIGWLIAGYLTYRIGAACYSRRVGLLAAAAFLTSIKAFLTSHLGRPESWQTAAILLAVYAAWLAIEQKRTFSAALLAGLASVVPLDFHVQSLAFVVPLALLFMADAGLRQRRFDLLGGYVAGSLIAGIVLAITHAWPSPEVAWRQLLEFTPHYTGLEESGPLGAALGNLASLGTFLYLIYWTAGGPLGLLEGGLGLLGLSAAGVRRNRPDVWLAALALGSLLIYGLVFSQRLVQYGVLWSPFVFILGLAALDRLVTQLAAGRLGLARATSLATMLGVGIAAANLVGDVWLVTRYTGGNMAEMNRNIAALVPPRSTVFGDPIWWWELQSGREFFSDDYLVWVALEQPGASPAAWMPQAVEHLRPDYILLDSAIGCEVSSGPVWSALSDYAAAHCELAGQVDGPWVGDEGKRTSLLAQTTRVYRCNL